MVVPEEVFKKSSKTTKVLLDLNFFQVKLDSVGVCFPSKSRVP
jgi:hypothetical protein